MTLTELSKRLALVAILVAPRVASADEPPSAGSETATGSDAGTGNESGSRDAGTGGDVGAGRENMGAPLDDVAFDVPAPSLNEEGPSAAPADASVVTVTVRGAPSDVVRRRRSAEAVDVVELHRAKRESADLGEVLARVHGVAVRRSGGLGSNARLSLNGLYDDQIRVFLDGVPLELAGYPGGVANVPVGLVERIDVYRGVVPIRFGADALGGALDLVTDSRYENKLSASYEVGSFGVRRLTVEGRRRNDANGFVFGGHAFFDYAKNDYPVDVEVTDARGRVVPATVKRFHDDYRSYGVSLEAGFVDRPWAKRILLRAYASTLDKDLQHNLVMSVPYGEARYGGTLAGANVRYEHRLSEKVDIDVLTSFVRRWISLEDYSRWSYDWFGQRVYGLPTPGEILGSARDQRIVQDSALARASMKWAISDAHSVRVTLSPTYTSRSGEERRPLDPLALDPLAARRDLFTFVTGLEHQFDAVRLRRGEEPALQNIVLLKDYVYQAMSEELLPIGTFSPVDTSKHSFGIGDALRFRFAPWIWAKASYEYATRMPRPDEVFGDGVLILSNLRLEPEVSHNANVGPHVELRHRSAGRLTVDVNGFARYSDRLIALLGNAQSFTYQNVHRARILGVENALAWTSPARLVALDGTFTYQDVRNTSDTGTFGMNNGDRIPHRPWLFASWGARLQLPGFVGRDRVEPFYVGRYIHSFFRAWESQGSASTKQKVDSQLMHSLGVTWIVERDLARIASTLEVQNLTDAKLFDFFGVQRPGRAIFFKVTGDL